MTASVTQLGEIDLSIIVPALNECENLSRLVDQVQEAITQAGIVAELILVDDGSNDDTLATMRRLARTRPWITVLHHHRSMGQSAALWSGVGYCRGRFTATLDADLQNDPSDLPRLLDRVQTQGVDMAQGLRVDRQDRLIRKVSSWVGRTARRWVLNDKIVDTGCSTRVLRTDILRRIPLQYAGMHRFIPAYAVMLGAKVIQVPVNHRSRQWGHTKYGVRGRALVGLLDCLAVRWMFRRSRTPLMTLMDGLHENTSTPVAIQACADSPVLVGAADGADQFDVGRGG